MELQGYFILSLQQDNGGILHGDSGLKEIKTETISLLKGSEMTVTSFITNAKEIYSPSCLYLSWEIILQRRHMATSMQAELIRLAYADELTN